MSKMHGSHPTQIERRELQELQRAEGIRVQRSPEGRVKSIQPGRAPFEGWTLLRVEGVSRIADARQMVAQRDRALGLGDELELLLKKDQRTYAELKAALLAVHPVEPELAIELAEEE